ncbi:MAG TPA: 3-hydroxybutyrate dehydrogenase [Chthonomonadaceae bacterium]|nr:3-hydroxybutyrate dehydrogenase [Chthonomonadaceae bacterium]
MRLQDRVAIVTGGASGIGREIALAFAAEGARVCVADIDATAAHRTAEEITRRTGAVAMAAAMDVTDEAQVEFGVRATAAAFGGIDILVSNAGIQHIAPLDELDYSNWRRVMAVHLDGAFLTTRACLRRMYPAGRGAVIYMGSVHSKLASPLKAPYVAAKHGLIGLCKAVAKEGAAHGVRANVICPGFVRTPMVERQISEQARALGLTEEEVVNRVMLKETVDGEFTTTEDVAAVAVMLAAFPTAALTGQSIVVSHGWHME